MIRVTVKAFEDHLKELEIKDANDIQKMAVIEGFFKTFGVDIDMEPQEKPEFSAEVMKLIESRAYKPKIELSGKLDSEVRSTIAAIQKAGESARSALMGATLLEGKLKPFSYESEEAIRERLGMLTLVGDNWVGGEMVKRAFEGPPQIRTIRNMK